MPSTRPAVVTAIRSGVRATDAPVITYGVIALCVLVFIAELLTGTSLLGSGGGTVYSQLQYIPQLTVIRPWTMVTTIFVHASLLHIAFNMFSMFIVGRQIEPMIGRVRFLALFLLSGIGGSVGMLLINPGTLSQATAVVGASGAIFGMFGAYFIIARHLGANATQLLVVIAINLGIGFIVPGFAWQAHVGGLVIGALVALVFVRTRARRQRGIQIGLTVAIAALLVVLTVAAVALHGIPT